MQATSTGTRGPGENKRISLCATAAAELSPRSPVLLGGKLPDCIARAGDYGFDAVELHIGRPSYLDVAAAVAASEKHRVAIAAIATGRAYVVDRLSLTDPDEAGRREAIARLLGFVDVAADCGAQVIVGCMRGNIPDVLDTSLCEQYEQRLADSLKKVNERAEPKAVGLLLEPINRYENNFLANADQTKHFLERYGLSNARILLDTFHMNIEDSDPLQSIVNCGALLGHLHVADSNRWYIGAGHIDFRPIVQALKSIGFAGCLSTEHFPLPDSHTAATRSIAALRKLCAA